MFPGTRSPGTTAAGQRFSEQTKLAVWQKALVVPGLSPGEFRLDSCGAVIAWSSYGSTINDGNGWEIDHILPVSRGGQDVLANLQVLQWQNNREKGNRLDANYCLVRRSQN